MVLNKCVILFIFEMGLVVYNCDKDQKCDGNCCDLS